MVIVYDALVGCIFMTIFQITERITPLVTKSSKTVLNWCADWLGFSIPAIPTRHCVPCFDICRIRYIIDFNRILLILR